MQNSMVMFTISLFDRIYLFWLNLVQKMKTVSLSWNLVPKLIWTSEFNGSFHFFCSRPEKPFLGKFCPTIQNYLFKVKFDSTTNLNTQNQWWCLFYLFWTRNTLFALPFLVKFGPNNQNGQFELKIGTKTKSNMKNSIFSIFDRKYPVPGNLFRNSGFFVEVVI